MQHSWRVFAVARGFNRFLTRDRLERYIPNRIADKAQASFIHDRFSADIAYTGLPQGPSHHQQVNSDMQIEIPGYEVKRKIAEGGMASVYLARQLNFDQDVALKIMNSSLSREPEFVKRFMKEARIMRKLRHQNLCEVFDVNAHGELYYIAMELLPGGTLAQLTRRGVTPAFASNLLLQLLQALDYAHRQGFIHRDIKPANILMRDSSTPVLTDFGIARAADAAAVHAPFLRREADS